VLVIILVALVAVIGGVIALTGYAAPKLDFRSVGICYRGKATSRDVTARLRTSDGGEIVITFPNDDPFFRCHK